MTGAPSGSPRSGPRHNENRGRGREDHERAGKGPVGAGGRTSRAGRHFRLVSGADRQGAQDLLGLLQRLGGRCDGRAALQLRHPDPDRALGADARRCRHAGHRHLARLVARRMDGRRPGRSFRPGAHAAGDHSLVLGLYLRLRLHAEFRTAPGLPRPAGFRIRRRMGGRRRPDRRDHPRRASGQGQRRRP